MANEEEYDPVTEVICSVMKSLASMPRGCAKTNTAIWHGIIRANATDEMKRAALEAFFGHEED